VLAVLLPLLPGLAAEVFFLLALALQALLLLRPVVEEEVLVVLAAVPAHSPPHLADLLYHLGHYLYHHHKVLPLIG
jgi:hypothetical protein